LSIARVIAIVEAQPLRLLSGVLRVADLLVSERSHTLPGERVNDLEPEAAVGQADDLFAARRRPLATRVGDHDDLELEPLGRMDGQEANGPGALLLGDGLELLDSCGVLLQDEADESLDVGAPQLLVRAREPGELAQVRVAPAPVPLREDGEVVVVLDDDLLAEALEPDSARHRRQAVVPLPERVEQPIVALGQRLGEPLLQGGEEWPPDRGPAERQQAVVGDAHEGRSRTVTSPSSS
jgi:hypothetical protein